MNFKCKHCGQDYEVDDVSAGQVAECLDCGKDFVIEPETVRLLPDNSSQPISLLISPTKIPNIKNYNKSPSEEMLCSDCGAILSHDAIICVNCGLNLKTGKKLTTNYEKDEIPETEARHKGASENLSRVTNENFFNSSFGYILTGMICVVLGFAITRNSYDSAVQRGGGEYGIYYGLVIVGIYRVFRGFVKWING